MRKNLALAVLAITLLTPAVSQAARDYGLGREAFPGEVYLGLKYGFLNFARNVYDSDGAELRNLGFTFGGAINDEVLLEFSYTTTVTKDDADNNQSSFAAETIGLFLVAKTHSDIYIKGRIGYTIVDQDFDILGQNFNDTVYGVAAGIGLGVKVGKEAALEFEYTVFPTTDDFESIPGSPFDLEAAFLSIGYILVFE